MANVITSVSDYLEKLKEIAVDENSQLFYRGVSNEEYAKPENNIPSIYRNNGWIENEDKMFYELVSKVPEEFKDCQNTFEYLVKMQHYGYPTRLLDITSNPLVALYFACVGNEKDDQSDGAVILFNIKKNNIRNYESDRVALVANLALSKRNILLRSFIINNLKTLLFEKSDVMTASIDDYDDLDNYVICNHSYWFTEIPPILLFLDSVIELFDQLANISSSESGGQINKIFKCVENIIDSVLSLDQSDYEDFRDVFEKLALFKDKIVEMKLSSGLFYSLPSHVMGVDISIAKTFYELVKIIGYEVSNLLKKDESFRLYQYDIKKWKSHFNTDLIDVSDMYRFHCVLPKQNNPRLIAQRGAFLLFGFNNESSDLITIKPEISSSFLIKKLLTIPQNKKQLLLDELFMLGISESTLFPEIDYVTKEIKERYR